MPPNNLFCSFHLVGSKYGCIPKISLLGCLEVPLNSCGGGWVVGSYPLSRQAPTHVEVELGCDKKTIIRLRRRLDTIGPMILSVTYWHVCVDSHSSQNIKIFCCLCGSISKIGTVSLSPTIIMTL
jgi:hypothetical protein